MNKRDLILGQMRESSLPAVVVMAAIMIAGFAQAASAGLSCRLYEELSGHRSDVTAVAFDRAGRLMATGDKDGSLRLWNTEAGELLKTIDGAGGTVSALAFSLDGDRLYAVGAFKGARSWAMPGGEDSDTLEAKQPLKSICMSPDGELVAAGGAKGVITVWDARSGREVASFKGHKGGVVLVRFTGESSLKSVGEDKKARLWSLNKPDALITSVDDSVNEVMTAACDAAMENCALGTVTVRWKKGHSGIKEYHNIDLKDAATWSRTGRFKGHEWRIRALGFSPDGRWLASGGDGKTIKVWDMETGRIEADFTLGQGLTSLCFSPDGQWLAAGTDAGAVRLYKLKGISAEPEVLWAAADETPDTSPGEKYAVVIGISDYRDPAIEDLPLAAVDAKAFYDFLVDPGLGGIDGDHVTLLLDDEADRAGIVDALKNRLPRQAGRDDTVIIYYSGHGVPDVDLTGGSDDGYRKYLAPRDAELARISATCIPMSVFRELFTAVLSRRVIIFVDSCFSGASEGDVDRMMGRTFGSGTTTARTRGVQISPGFLQEITKGPEGYGKVLITASRANETALEIPALGHGLFTYYLLDALSGKCDGGDGYLTVKEVYDHLSEYVAMRARREGGNQNPMFFGSTTGRIVIHSLDESE